MSNANIPVNTNKYWRSPWAPFQKGLAPYFTIDQEITESPEWQKAINAPSSEEPKGDKFSVSAGSLAEVPAPYAQSKEIVYF